MEIKPLGDRVLIKVLEPETKTKSGIFLPETAKEKPQEGEVVATGEGKLLEDGKRASMSVKKGDKVMFGNRYAGVEVTINGKDHLVISEDNIVAIIK